MPTYSRDDFTAPVKDYDFSAVSDVASLIDQMSTAGGFTATKLAHARDILRESVAKSGEKGVLNWWSFHLFKMISTNSFKNDHFKRWLLSRQTVIFKEALYQLSFQHDLLLHEALCWYAQNRFRSSGSMIDFLHSV